MSSTSINISPNEFFILLEKATSSQPNEEEEALNQLHFIQSTNCPMTIILSLFSLQNSNGSARLHKLIFILIEQCFQFNNLSLIGNVRQFWNSDPKIKVIIKQILQEIFSYSDETIRNILYKLYADIILIDSSDEWFNEIKQQLLKRESLLKTFGFVKIFIETITLFSRFKLVSSFQQYFEEISYIILNILEIFINPDISNSHEFFSFYKILFDALIHSLKSDLLLSNENRIENIATKLESIFTWLPNYLRLPSPELFMSIHLFLKELIISFYYNFSNPLFDNIRINIYQFSLNSLNMGKEYLDSPLIMWEEICQFEKSVLMDISIKDAIDKELSSKTSIRSSANIVEKFISSPTILQTIFGLMSVEAGDDIESDDNITLPMQASILMESIASVSLGTVFKFVKLIWNNAIHSSNPNVRHAALMSVSAITNLPDIPFKLFESPIENNEIIPFIKESVIPELKKEVYSPIPRIRETALFVLNKTILRLPSLINTDSQLYSEESIKCYTNIIENFLKSDFIHPKIITRINHLLLYIFFAFDSKFNNNSPMLKMFDGFNTLLDVLWNYVYERISEYHINILYQIGETRNRLYQASLPCSNDSVQKLWEILKRTLSKLDELNKKIDTTEIVLHEKAIVISNMTSVFYYLNEVQTTSSQFPQVNEAVMALFSEVFYAMQSHIEEIWNEGMLFFYQTILFFNNGGNNLIPDEIILNIFNLAFQNLDTGLMTLTKFSLCVIERILSLRTSIPLIIIEQINLIREKMEQLINNDAFKKVHPEVLRVLCVILVKKRLLNEFDVANELFNQFKVYIHQKTSTFEIDENDENSLNEAAHMGTAFAFCFDQIVSILPVNGKSETECPKGLKSLKPQNEKIFLKEALGWIKECLKYKVSSPQLIDALLKMLVNFADSISKTNNQILANGSIKKLLAFMISSETDYTNSEKDKRTIKEIRNVLKKLCNDI